MKLKNIFKQWNRFDKKYGKVMTLGLGLIIVFYAGLLYGISFHNLDLMSNYALLFNDINGKYFCNEDYINIREIQDCNGNFECPDYQTIYINSNNIQVLAFLMLMGTSIGLLITNMVKK